MCLGVWLVGCGGMRGWVCPHKRPARQQVRCVVFTQTINVRAEEPLPLFQHTPGPAFGQWLGIHSLDAALNAELLLDIFHTVKYIVKLMPMHQLITQCMNIYLYSSDSCINIVQPRINAIESRINTIKPRIDPTL
jgi:hypothetical protein